MSDRRTQKNIDANRDEETKGKKANITIERQGDIPLQRKEPFKEKNETKKSNMPSLIRHSICTYDEIPEEEDDLIESWAKNGYQGQDAKIRQRELTVVNTLLSPNPKICELVPKAENITEKFWEEIGFNVINEKKRGTSAEWRTPYTAISKSPNYLKGELEVPSEFK